MPRGTGAKAARPRETVVERHYQTRDEACNQAIKLLLTKEGGPTAAQDARKGVRIDPDTARSIPG